VIELDPASCLSARPGTDGALISRREIRSWLSRVEAATDRLRIRTLGTSTEGRPIDAVIIAADLAGDRLDALLARRRAVVDSLLRGDPAPAWEMPVVLVTSGIHATEVGGPQSVPELIHWLVFDESPEARAIRQRVVTIIVPTLNPDGMDLVQRWHDTTAGTPRAGSLPPLLYHRHAGHDNNRDWLFRNLRETRVVLDALHRPWLPHVTLDQHQMNPQGPRFVLPPYADPWEPHVHPVIVAAGNGLGQAIATDMSLAGLAGVTTGRYFDAWEPSRAIQHYRGGVRILAEAASANLAWPIEIGAEQLASPPLPQEMSPTTATPRPWPGGTWRLGDIVACHLAAAKSLLTHVATDAERWPRVQREALGERLSPPIVFHLPQGRPALDIAANRRVAAILQDADLANADTGSADVACSTGTPLGRMTAALLAPKSYPDARGPRSYDVTTHHLPLLTGAVVSVADSAVAGAPGLGDGRWLVVDARSHRAPQLAERARRAGADAAWRVPAPAMAGTTLIDTGAWLIDRTSLPPDLHALAHAAIDEPPPSAARVGRRDIVLLAVGEQPAPDHGWTRWWLEARRVPYLEADATMLGALATVAPATTLLIADTPRPSLDDAVIERITAFLDAGGHAIAFGRAGRALATAIAPVLGASEFEVGGPVHAPGALLRLIPTSGHPIALGLDRAIPAMLQRDGVFHEPAGILALAVLGRFAARDTLVSGWMSDLDAVRNAPAIVEVRRGDGRLHAFAFQPLFRGQTLVTSPLVHNLIYSMETSPCPPLAPAKTNASSTSARTS
jgi:hypothetical protein